MTRKRTVVVAGAISAVLFTASAAFALASGLFGAGRADRVGTFQTIEQRLAPPTTAAAASGASTATSATSATTTSGEPRPTTAPSSSAAPGPNRPIPESSSSSGALPQATVSASPAPSAVVSTISTSDRERHEHGADDNGRESDD